MKEYLTICFFMEVHIYHCSTYVTLKRQDFCLPLPVYECEYAALEISPYIKSNINRAHILFRRSTVDLNYTYAY